MAGVALDDMDCYFAWQAWHLWHWVGSGGALGQPWRRDAAAFCVAGVALRDICLHFVWQAWHFVTSTFDPPSLFVAGVALDDMDFYFAWQAWHLWHWVGSSGALGQPWRRDAAAFCVAGVALDDLTTGPFFRFWRITQQCCSWKRSCHKEPPGVTFMPSSAGTIRVSLKLLWATSACCVPRGSLQRRCRCHMPLGCVSQKCNWRRLSGLCNRPRLSVVVRDVRCGCYLVLDLIQIPCAVYTVYSQGS